MAAFDQPVTVYSDTTAQYRVISDYIFNTDPMDTPVVAHFGLDSANSKFRLSSPDSQYKIELLEDTYQPLTTALANGTSAAQNLTTSTLSFTVADGSLLQDGFVILIDSEYMVVSGVSTNTVTVDARNYGGTNATHATNATITIVGMARKSGDDADYVGLSTLSNPYNYTSIFQKGIQASGSEQFSAQYGKGVGSLDGGGEYAYQMAKAIPELNRWIERAFFHSVRRVGTAAVARAMGGLVTYVPFTTAGNTSSITTTLTKASIDAVAQAIYSDGGVPDVLILAPGGAGTLHTLMDSSSFVRIDQENTVFGMRPITRISTQFFDSLVVLTSRHCPVKKAYMLESSKVGFYTYRPFMEHKIAVTGDSIKGEVLGEFSLLVANGTSSHGTIGTSATSL